MSTTNMTTNINTYTTTAKAKTKAKLGSALRIAVASLLLTFASLFSLGDTGVAFAKKAAKKTVQKTRSIKAKAKSIRPIAMKAIRAGAAKVKKVGGGEFKLLNGYKAMAAANPALAAKWNSAKEGMASWYGGFFHGRKTAMGTTYNMNEMTAAHRTLPLGTVIKVTNLENNQDVVVTVTDRGPYVGVGERILDLSKAAAQAVGYFDKGVGHIKYEILNSPEGVTTGAAFTDVQGASENLAHGEEDDGLFSFLQPVVDAIAGLSIGSTSILNFVDELAVS